MTGIYGCTYDCIVLMNAPWGEVLRRQYACRSRPKKRHHPPYQWVRVHVCTIVYTCMLPVCLEVTFKSHMVGKWEDAPHDTGEHKCAGFECNKPSHHLVTTLFARVSGTTVQQDELVHKKNPYGLPALAPQHQMMPSNPILTAPVIDKWWPTGLRETLTSISLGCEHNFYLLQLFNLEIGDTLNIKVHILTSAKYKQPFSGYK